MKIVLLGAPGAGKDTLAEHLAGHGWNVLSPGSLYRKEFELKTEFGIKAYSYWGDGNLCPDDMTNELMKKAASDLSSSKGIYNGYPRTIAQAKFLDSFDEIFAAIQIKVSDDVVIDRLVKRGRIDDTEEGIRTRLNIYHKNSSDLIDYYKVTNRFIAVDGSSTPEAVCEETIQALRRKT